MECLEERSKTFVETEKLCEQNRMLNKNNKKEGEKWHTSQHIGLSLHCQCHYVESQLSFINAVLFITHVRYK